MARHEQGRPAVEAATAAQTSSKADHEDPATEGGGFLSNRLPPKGQHPEAKQEKGCGGGGGRAVFCVCGHGEALIGRRCSVCGRRWPPSLTMTAPMPDSTIKKQEVEHYEELMHDQPGVAPQLQPSVAPKGDQLDTKHDIAKALKAKTKEQEKYDMKLEHEMAVAGQRRLMHCQQLKHKKTEQDQHWALGLLMAVVGRLKPMHCQGSC